MNREMCNHVDIKFRVERMDSIHFLHQPSSEFKPHSGQPGDFISGPLHKTLKWGAGNWTVPTQEITALCQNLQEKHVFKFAVNAQHI